MSVDQQMVEPPQPSSHSGEEPFIVISGVSKWYGSKDSRVVALDNISFSVGRGEYLSIMGPSGSGKSTLFNMIGALDHPSTGMVEIAGLDLADLSRRQLAHFRGNYIGYIFQAYNLIPAYSALDNVLLPLLFSGCSYDNATNRARAVLEEVGLEHRLNHRPNELSGGQQQRVAIARALANEPKIILADEPTANLDLQTGEEIIELLSDLCRNRGVTVVAATHDHKMLLCSDRIAWIVDGGVERIQTPSEADIKAATLSSE